eukprot:1013829-Rhodomonas_salina.4
MPCTAIGQCRTLHVVKYLILRLADVMYSDRSMCDTEIGHAGTRRSRRGQTLPTYTRKSNMRAQDGVGKGECALECGKDGEEERGCATRKRACAGRGGEE